MDFLDLIMDNKQVAFVQYGRPLDVNDIDDDRTSDEMFVSGKAILKGGFAVTFKEVISKDGRVVGFKPVR